MGKKGGVCDAERKVAKFELWELMKIKSDVIIKGLSRFGSDLKCGIALELKTTLWASIQIAIYIYPNIFSS